MRPAVVTRALAVLGVLAVLLLAGAGLTAPTAWAHTVLSEATPAPGETVYRLDSVRLVFGLPLAEQARHSVQVFDPAGTRWDTGPVVQDGQAVSVAVAPVLAATGEYAVRWCVIAADGHPQSGAYQFSYTGATSAVAPAPLPAPDNAGCAATETDDSVVTAGWVLLTVIVGSALYIGIAAALRWRGSRPPTGNYRRSRSD